ncbi:MAG: minor capsid protein [Ruminococcus flavefaciens]|nr:minor capsid protein [Eubacterium sp.]MCM1236712.1 minor capsid protein [Ruminococcus flavefaciens]
MANDYWERRYLKDKAASINRAEDYLAEQQKKLYKQAEEEIQEQIQKVYERFASREKISLAEAKRYVKEADFRRIDWDAMLEESKNLRERLKEDLPEEVRENLERQHRDLDETMKAYAVRGRISYLELRSMEIDRIIVDLYDQQQQKLYDYLTSEYDDGYYRSIYNTQQHMGFGYDFTRPNERAVDTAILNRYDKRNFSRSLYAHCTNFSEDLRSNLVSGLIAGENLDRMAARIHRRMGVASSAAKTLVRTETAYIYEKATMAGYRECGIEWYEFLATLDDKTSKICQEMDGKHFKVTDAVPGKNFPPMHPNCRSTTVCWFPEEETKKSRTTRIAKDGNGKYYEVPADMTYKEWWGQHKDKTP